MKKTMICLLLAVMMIASPMLNGYVYAEDVVNNENTETEEKVTEFDYERLHRDMGFLEIVVQLVLNEYIYDVDTTDVIDEIYRGFFNALDKYSVYYSAEEFSKFSTQMSGEIVGVGVHMIKKENGIEIIDTIPGSPAEAAGLKANDLFVEVDGINVIEYSLDDIANLLRGKEGTSVDVKIERGGMIMDFTLERAVVVISSIFTQILDDNIAYIKISEFKGNTDELFKEELDKFKEKNIEKVIVDVRNNPGGSVDSVLNILGNFISEKPLLIERKANNKEIVYTSAKTDNKFDLCVLINKNSASASEIFAGAIQDYSCGTIIGETSFGKGVVQKLIQLLDGSGFKYTSAEYFTPNRNKVQGIGIVPDIEVSQELLNGDIDIEDIPELKMKREPKMGTVGLDVLGAEMILDILGYEVGEVDGILDDDTYYEIARYQRDNKLYAHGILDKTTQAYLTADLKKFVEQEKDSQLERAVEELRKKE